MEFDIQTTSIIGLMLTLATLVVTSQKIVKNTKKSKEEGETKILQKAKEEDSLIRIKLEARIEKIDAQLKNLEFNVQKDIVHLRDNYTTEIKSLGDKIEILREELNERHSALIDLLTKIVTKK